MSHTLFQLLRDTPKIDGAMPALVSKLPNNPVTFTFNLRSLEVLFCKIVLSYVQPRYTSMVFALMTLELAPRGSLP